MADRRPTEDLHPLEFLPFTQYLALIESHAQCVARRLRCEDPRLRELKIKLAAASIQQFLVELLAFVAWVISQQEERR